jgi:hypothetical protein
MVHMLAIKKLTAAEMFAMALHQWLMAVTKQKV